MKIRFFVLYLFNKYLFQQGPCAEGYWLVLSAISRKPICRRNPCIEKELEDPSDHMRRQFWTYVDGKCVKTLAPGFCTSSFEVYHYREGAGVASCVLFSEVDKCKFDKFISRPCWVGQKFFTMERCQDSVGLWGNEDDH